jgi:hypothetical protein
MAKKHEETETAPAQEAAPATVEALQQQLAETQAQLKAAMGSPRGSQQPSPRDVLPGQVWDPKINRFVTYAGGTHTRFTIKSPFKGFNGEKAGVHFREGVGRTNDPDLATWFASLDGGKDKDDQPVKYEVTGT